MEASGHIQSTPRTCFKFSPGEKAYKWEEFYQEGIMAIRFSKIKSANPGFSKRQEEMNKALNFPPDSNRCMGLWLFKTAREGDVVFANNGDWKETGRRLKESIENIRLR